jgi:hypothetical protein
LLEALFDLDEAIFLNNQYSDAYELRADILFIKKLFKEAS